MQKASRWNVHTVLNLMKCVFMGNRLVWIISNVIASRGVWRLSPVSYSMQKCVTGSSKQVSDCVRFGFVSFLGLFFDFVLMENIFIGISVRLSCSKLVASWLYLICSRNIHRSVNQMLLSVFRRSSHLEIKKTLQTAQRILMLIS